MRVTEYRDLGRCICMCAPVRAIMLFVCALECDACVRSSAMYACDGIWIYIALCKYVCDTIEAG